MEEINKRDITKLKHKLKSYVDSITDIGNFDRILNDIEKIARADEKAKVILKLQDDIRKLFVELIN